MCFAAIFFIINTYSIIYMEKRITKVRTAKDIIITIALLVLGAACFAFRSTGMMILGGMLIFTGIALLVVLTSGYRLEGEEGVLKKKEHYFPDSKYDVIYSEINAGRMITDYSDEDKAIIVRLDVYSNSSGKKFAELYKYIPYDYVRKIELTEVS